MFDFVWDVLGQFNEKIQGVGDLEVSARSAAEV
jgi:hypothetical protein